MSNLHILENAIGYTFKDKRLLVEALTHPSAKVAGRGDNALFELLGAAAIQFIVTKEVVARRLGTIGVISKTRDNVCSKDVLLRIALSLEIEDYLCISKGMQNNLSAGLEKALVSAVEAIAGAIFSDGGYSALEGFARKFLFLEIDKVGVKDPKTLLQEAMQARQQIAPVYRLLEEAGPEHKKVFTVGVYAGSYLLARGSGSTKKEAEKAAAQRALQIIVQK